MNESRIPVVTRADGETINVVKKRGHLFVCSLDCGRTEKGFHPVLQDLHPASGKGATSEPRSSDAERLRNIVID